jgi:hypothetical protein
VAQAASVPATRPVNDLQPRLYSKEVDQAQTEEDIKTLCTDKGGVALWRPNRGEEGVANLNSEGDIQDYDSAMVAGATLNWVYGARLAAMESVAYVSVVATVTSYL